MKVSAISQNPAENNNQRRNLFIRFSNSFMSLPTNENPIEKTNTINPIEPPKKPEKMGIENLEEFTVFPKETIDGKTIITA